MEEIEVWKDSEKRLTEMDKDGYVQYCVLVEVAQTDSLEFRQISQEWVYRKSQPLLEIIFKCYSFVGMRHSNGNRDPNLLSGSDNYRCGGE